MVRLKPDTADSAYTAPVPSSLQALLARAGAALERGCGSEAAPLLAPALRSSALTRDDELALRSMLAEAWLLQDDVDQATAAHGRSRSGIHVGAIKA